MHVADGRIVSIAYSVMLDDGTVVESVPEDAPVDYLHGAKVLIPALEAKLTGTREGDRRRFILQPDEAYGQRDESDVMTLPRSVFLEQLDLAPGQRLGARTSEGDLYPLTVREVRAAEVVVDLNHPLAGKTLHFAVRVMAVRTAGQDELFTGKPKPVEVV